MRKLLLATAALLAIGAAAPVSAAPSQSPPVPSNVYITVDGLDWAWASPCSGGCSTITLVDVFRFATEIEWDERPDPSAFLDPAGNFDGDEGPMRCASAWFDNSFDHCDYSDAVEGFLTSEPNDDSWETWLVRGQRQGGEVSEPATLALLGAGLLGLAAIRRRKAA